jgi:hypothetical protein
MPQLDPNPCENAPKLRWYQWRLRSLFTLVFFASIGMSYVAVTVQDQRQQKNTADAIRKAGGSVESNQTWLGRLLRDDSLVHVTAVQFPDHSANTELRHLLASRHIEWRDAGSQEATDADLASLRGLKQLKWLDAGSPKVTDAGLAGLRGLKQLRHLDLSGATLTDAGLINVEGLSQLHTLSLGNTNVTDSGLVHLHGLKQLKNLCLTGTQITDAGLTYLQGLSQLQLVVLHGTRVTDRGVKMLRRALPSCTINYSDQDRDEP